MKSSVPTSRPRTSAFLCGLLAVATSACAAGEPSFVRTAMFPPHEPGCKVEVLGIGAPPPPGYGVAAKISIPNRTTLASSEELITRFHSEICAAGGELLVTRVRIAGSMLRVAGVDVVGRLPAPGTAEMPVGCVPSCGLGFLCENNKCVPPCSPACDTGEACGPDRTCHKVK